MNPENENNLGPVQDIDDTSGQQVVQDANIDISWQAPQFVEYEKPSSWYLIVVLVSVVIGAALYLLTKDFITAFVMLVVGFVFAYSGAKKPKIIDYYLNSNGFGIASREFSFSDFKYFICLDEEDYVSIVFVPFNRFSVSAALYTKKDDEEKIVNILSERLPMENRDLDVIDKFLKRIHF